MAWYNYIPVVGDIVEGAKASAHPTDLSPYDVDRQQEQSFGAQLQSDRANINTRVPLTKAQQIAAGTVTAGQTQTAAIDDAQAQQIRDRQLSAVQMLQDRANGIGPSAAQFAYRNAAQDITHQQLGMAGQARGNAAISARRNAARSIMEQQQRDALNLGQIRAGEMATATGQLSGALSGVRDTDTALALRRAQMEQENRFGNRQYTFNADVGNRDAALAAATRNQSADLQSQQGNQTSTLRGQEITNQARAEAARAILQSQELAHITARDKIQQQEAIRQRTLARSDNAWQTAAKTAADVYTGGATGLANGVK